MLLIALSLILLLAAVYLLWRAGRERKSAGLPRGRILYNDTGMWNRVEKPLYDAMLALTGKPDYLVEQGGKLVPVEVKSGWAPTEPHHSHVLQLAAYCLLVDRSYGKRPPYGILKYRNRSFAVDYTPELENTLLDLLDEIRRQERKGEAARSHEQPGRCARCGYRKTCQQRL